MPSAKQIESVSKALRKSVSRWNKAKLKLDKADQAYQKGRNKKIGQRDSSIKTINWKNALRSLVSRWNKAKAEFDRAQQAYEKAQAKYKAVHRQLPHGSK